MIKKTLDVMITYNVMSLNFYKNDFDNDTRKEILDFTYNILTNLPWYFNKPIKLLIVTLNMLSLITKGKLLYSLSPDILSKIMTTISSLPVISMLNKLISAITYLRFFDFCSSVGRRYSLDK